LRKYGHVLVYTTSHENHELVPHDAPPGEGAVAPPWVDDNGVSAGVAIIF
jgi:hypothetical protein